MNTLGCTTEVLEALAEMLGKKSRKSAQPEVEVQCAAQLRRIGDKLNFRQKLMYLISKLFSLVT